MEDEDDKKKKKKSIHPFDVWPPPRDKKEEEFSDKLSEKKPLNSGYIESEYPTEGELIVYDAEEEEQSQTDEDKKDDEDEKDERNEK